MRFAHARRCWLLVVLLSLAVPTFASTAVRRTLPELAAGADLIFVGRCESVFSHWDEDHTLILTAYRFRVTRVIKGKPVVILVLDEMGGRIGDVATAVPGTPGFQVGEETLLFVYRTELGRWETYCGGQGKFRIVRDREGRPWVDHDLFHAELQEMSPPDRRGEGAPLNVFAARMQAAARPERSRR